MTHRSHLLILVLLVGTTLCSIDSLQRSLPIKKKEDKEEDQRSHTFQVSFSTPLPCSTVKIEFRKNAQRIASAIATAKI